MKALKAGLAARPRAVSKIKPSKSVTKRRKGDRTAIAKDLATTAPLQEEAEKAKSASWGILEPIHGILGPIGDILSPFISANMIIGFLVLIILFNYIRSPSSKSVSRTGARGGPSQAIYGIPNSPERIAAYEAIWQKEEADLWDWLEQRVSMHAADAATLAGRDKSSEGDQEAFVKAKTLKDTAGAGVKRTLESLRMGGREIEEAIKVTEERLKVLKGVVGEEKRLKEAKR